MAMSIDTGLGSGLNIKSIVESMVQSQSAPKTNQLERLQKDTNEKISGVGKLKSALDALQSSIKKLSDSFSGSGSLKVITSDDKQVGASIGTSASPGSYTVKIDQLATAAKVTTAAISDGKSFSSGTLDLKIGDTSFAVDIAEGSSLEEVRNSINKALGDKGVSATIVTDSSAGQKVSRLIIGSDKSGAGNSISLTGSNDSLDILKIDGSSRQEGSGGGYLIAPQDAVFSVDGLQMSAKSNNLQNIFSGVSLELKPEGIGKTTTISVAVDKEGVLSNVKEFLSSYNNLVQVSASLTKVSQDSDGKSTQAGALIGDASLRQLMSSVRKELSNPGGSDVILADLGITTQKDGSLSIESSKFDRSIDSGLDKLSKVLSGDSGLLSRLNGVVKVFNQAGGVLSEKNDSLQNTLSTIRKQQDSLSRSSAALEARLYSQFNAMDKLVGQLTNTGSSLLASLNALSSK